MIMEGLTPTVVPEEIPALIAIKAFEKARVYKLISLVESANALLRYSDIMPDVKQVLSNNIVDLLLRNDIPFTLVFKGIDEGDTLEVMARNAGDLCSNMEKVSIKYYNFKVYSRQFKVEL